LLFSPNFCRSRPMAKHVWMQRSSWQNKPQMTLRWQSVGSVWLSRASIQGLGQPVVRFLQKLFLSIAHIMWLCERYPVNWEINVTYCGNCSFAGLL
jgi:hypothetical protein